VWVSAINRYSLPTSAGAAKKPAIKALQKTRLPAPSIAILAREFMGSGFLG